MADRVEDLIRAAADKHGIPAEFALAIAEQESGFNPTAIGPEITEGSAKGHRAIGTFQIIPPTAQRLGIDPKDPRQNIDGGVRYIRELFDQHNGNLDAVLRSYGGVVRNTTYVPEVMARYQKFRGGRPASPPATSTAPPPIPAGAAEGMLAPSTVGGGGPVPPPKPSPGALMRESFTGMLGFAGMDPTTPEGRRNLAATAVTLPIGGALARAGVMGFRAAVPMIAAAGTAGAVTEAGNQALAGGPPKPTGIAAAAAEQAGYEAFGPVVAWPAKAIGRRLIASKVGRHASEALSASRQHLVDQLDAGLKAAHTTAESLKTRLGMQAPSVSRPQAGTMAVGAIRGPAKTAKDAAGEAVEQAASSGQAIPTQPLRDRLAELSEQVTPQVGAGSVKDDLALLNTYKTGASLAPAEVSAYQSALARVQSSQSMLPAEHRLPRALEYARSVIGEADSIPFSEAHKLKRILDDAVNWDQKAKKQAEQMAKGFRGTLRDLMKGHAPYDEATSAYTAVARLHDRGYAPQLLKVAESNPESITKLIKGDEPTKTRMLRDLLLGETAKGGGAAQGEAAWNAVRAAWTHENLVRGGIEKMGARIAKLDPDFQHTMYGDRAGQLVLRNLEQLSGAYGQALERATAIKAAQQAAKKPTALETSLKGSTLGHAPTLEQEGADVFRAITLGPQSIWGGMSLMRLLRGPKMQELVQWASYSPKWTQMLVTTLTNPAVGMMTTDLARLMDMAGVVEPVTTPPPAPSRAAGAGPRGTVTDVNGRQIPLSGPPPQPSR